MKKTILISLLSLVSLKASAQNFYDESTIQTIEITFAQSNWDALLDNATSTTEDYIMATSVTINGVVFDSVGVKYKGNSTYNASQVKNPFHIELDAYKNHDYQGFKDIKLSNVKNDPSFVREVLSYQIGRKYMDAPRCNYANVYVNGTLIGLYSNPESITKTFLQEHFNDDNNTFVKCNPPAGAGPMSNDKPNLVYLGTDSSQYYAKYELKSTYGWDELIDLCDTLNNDVNDIAAILDVDRAIWMLAFDNVLVNLDSYIGVFAQNYYLYRDDFNKFIPIIWDMNESFGRFSMLGSGNLTTTTQKQQLSHLINISDANYPLVSKLLSIPMYKKMYLAHVKTILQENFSNNDYFTAGQTLQNTISAAVQADPNKFYTYANFTSNLTTDIAGGGGPGGGATPGITNLMNGRATYLLAQSDFTQVEPAISNIQVSNPSPNLNESLDFTADVTNANAVYFGYRTQNHAPFVRYAMFDDGLHNDGAAGDGTYGMDATMSTSFFQYYIYAENSGIGKFSPVRAEHEYYSLNLNIPVAGDVVINEVLASNLAGDTDFDGEFDDWIELYNNTNSAIDLSTYYLTDDGTNFTQWQFPSGTTLPASGYVTVWADKDDLQVGLHANFKLSSLGESLYLLNNNTIVDQVTFGAQTDDISYGRYVNGTGSFIFMSPTFSSQNSNSLVVDEISKDGELIVFPNPANETIQFRTNSTDLIGQELSIFNLAGKRVYTGEFAENYQVDISEWESGLYLVQLGNFRTKLVVN